MPFHWKKQSDETLLNRFHNDFIGRKAWLTWAEYIEGSVENWSKQLPIPDEAYRETVSEFDRFLGSLRNQGTTTNSVADPVVFVSHQSKDVCYAERVAEIACSEGIDYWLDVHDPMLRTTNATISPCDPHYPLLIASIIEIGLLNSTHVLAINTDHSLASKWVPYEFGRAKDRSIESLNAGSWFHPDADINCYGDYIRLGCICHGGGETPINRLLAGWSLSPKLGPFAWPYGPKDPLP